MFSDIYKIKETDIFYEVEGKVSEDDAISH